MLGKVAFSYTTGWLSMTAVVGNTVTYILSIGGDANFICQRITGAARQASLLVAAWAGDVQINESVKGRDLFNAAIPFDSIAGDGRNPFYFDPPRLFTRNTSLLFTFTNNIATATDVQLTLHGFKMSQEGL